MATRQFLRGIGRAKGNDRIAELVEENIRLIDLNRELKESRLEVLERYGLKPSGYPSAKEVFVYAILPQASAATGYLIGFERSAFTVLALVVALALIAGRGELRLIARFARRRLGLTLLAFALLAQPAFGSNRGIRYASAHTFHTIRSHLTGSRFNRSSRK